MRVVLFTEGLMRRDPKGQAYPVRDLYPRFIRKLGPLVGGLTMAAPCEPTVEEADPARRLVQDQHFAFVGLPFYGSAADFYRRLAVVLPRSIPTIVALVRSHDLVLLRLPNRLGPWAALIARLLRRPLLLYWAGPPVTEAVRHNYASGSSRDRLARLTAAAEVRVHRLLARVAAGHFFIDERQHELLGRPEPTHWVLPTLVRSSDVADAPTARGAGPLRLVFAGRLIRHKGIFELLEAVRMAKVADGAELHLDIAGAGPQEEELRRRVSELSLGHDVCLRGHLTWVELQALLRGSHVFVLPTYAEGLPKVMWEAWAAGTALITCPVGSIERYVRDGENGLLVSPGSAAELSKAIVALERSEDLRLRIAGSGLASARAHTWEKEVGGIAGEIFRRLEETRDRDHGQKELRR